MRLAQRLAALLFVLSVLSLARVTRADENGPQSHLHLTLGVGHAVGEPQSHELGWGGELGATYELRFARILGLEAELDAIELAPGDAPVNPGFASHTQGFAVDAVAGLRITPLGRVWKSGPWIEGLGGIAYTGGAGRPIVQARLGWDLLNLEHLGTRIAPFVGYTQVFQSSDSIRPDDAHILWIGAAFDIGPRPKPRATGDRDRDGIVDEQDACPDIPGIPAADPAANGCPPPMADRDKDGIFDSDDACPDVPGIHTFDPKTNGCPDRDKDGVPDKVDACPDVPGVPSSDPKTNGCPLPPDRDKDGVLDADDACPDVPGVHTDDPKTNGCPAASDSVHVEGDQIVLDDIIHFDTGSPRVRHVSWPLLKKLADYFTATPGIEEVDIEGHADETGRSEYNLYLSRERAASVKRLLVKNGVAPDKLTTHAYGDTRPREPGHDERAHRENRRVEFTITKAHGAPPPEPPGANKHPGAEKHDATKDSTDTQGAADKPTAADTNDATTDKPAPQDDSTTKPATADKPAAANDKHTKKPTDKPDAPAAKHEGGQ